MGLFWYPEINEKYLFEGKPDKPVLMSSYIRYFLARLQSMFIYEGLPDTIPQKWLENLLLVNGSCVWIMNGDKGLIVTRAGIGGEPDVYYIPTKAIVANPYVEEGVDRTYTRDVDCVLMVNDTYAQGLLPLIKKYSAMLVENEITMNIADVMARASILLSAADDETKASAELWLKRLIEGQLGIIGEADFVLSDKALTVNNLSNAASMLTDLIEYQQYIKASFYNDIGLQSNYNMKREAINSNESQLNEDMLHPLIDNMLKERQDALEKVNAMFGTNITVRFNSAWEINEREEEAAINQIEATAEMTEEQAEAPIEESAEEIETREEDTDSVEETTAEIETEEVPADVVELSEDTIEEIAEAVVDLIEEDKEGEEDAEEDK
jgi:hypothetical protein